MHNKYLKNFCDLSLYFHENSVLILQCLTDIFYNILCVLNADAEADHGRINTCLYKLLIGQLSVRMAGRMKNSCAGICTWFQWSRALTGP